MPLKCDYRALIIGMGSLGSHMAWTLSKLGVKVYGQGRHGPVLGPHYFDPGTGQEAIALEPWQQVVDIFPLDVVLVFVKAFDLPKALLAVPREALKNDSSIIVVANGFIDKVVGQSITNLPNQGWRIGVSTIGVSRINLNKFSLKSTTGQIIFGPISAKDDRFVRPNRCEDFLLKSLGTTVSWQEDMSEVVRRKWLYNTVLNSICAAGHLAKNGDALLDNGLLTRVFDQAWLLMNEVFAPDQPRHNLVSLADEKPMLGLYESWYTGLIQLINATFENENSMACDVRLGRQTESDFLAGLALSAKNSHKFSELIRLHRLIIQ